jgi:hypothetical protein
MTTFATNDNRSCSIHLLTMRHGAVMGLLLQRDAGGEQQHRCVDGPGAWLCAATIADTDRNDIDAIDVDVR